MRRLALVFVLAGCTPSTAVDGGLDGAADVEFDGPLACAADAGLADGGIEKINATHAPFQAACTPQQIADYAQCQGAKQTDKCTQFKPGQPGESCGKCIETPIDAPEWGVLVFSGTTTAFFNVEGCVNDALGQSGDPSCGQDLHNLYRCQEIMCGACTGNDFTLCELQTIDPQSAGACASFDQAVFSPTGMCSAITGDAAPPPDVTNCFPDTSKANDPQAQEVDWLTRIVGYMCGAPP